MKPTRYEAPTNPDLDHSCVFIPVVLLFPEGRDGTAFHAEKKLWAAVLQDAIREFAKGNQDATAWIFDEDAGPGFGGFSFQQVCDALEIDAGYLKAGLLRYTRDELRSMLRRREHSMRPGRVAA